LGRGIVKFDPGLDRGVLVRRYKRFLADIETSTGEAITIHCPNTGAMIGCAEPGSTVWYSTSSNRRRKYAHTLEIVRAADGCLVGVNTSSANGLVAQALSEGMLPGFRRGAPVAREVAIPGERGRFDLMVGDTFLEVKSVTLRRDDGGAFPDAVSVRATRHVDALARLARAGRPCALVFCVMHNGIDAVRPADEIDPAYGRALRGAVADGVRVLGLRCRVTPREIRPTGTVPVNLESAS